MNVPRHFLSFQWLPRALLLRRGMVSWPTLAPQAHLPCHWKSLGHNAPLSRNIFGKILTNSHWLLLCHLRTPGGRELLIPHSVRWPPVRRECVDNSLLNPEDEIREGRVTLHWHQVWVQDSVKPVFQRVVREGLDIPRIFEEVESSRLIWE